MKQSDKAAALALTPVSRETEIRLDRYVALLEQWQAKTNLIAPSTLENIWTRHIADSLQLLSIAPSALSWADFGSGGGFPGIVLACAIAGRGGTVHLVERNAKKAAFLREAVRVTVATATVYPIGIEDFVEKSEIIVECVTARALAPLDKLVGLAHPLITRGAKGLFLKGQDIDYEIKDATKSWALRYNLHPSATGPGTIIEITSASPKVHAAPQ